MKPHYAEVFGSEEQADLFESLSVNSDIIPNVIQRQGVEVIIEEVGLGFKDMDRKTQYRTLSDISRGMSYLVENDVYHLDIKQEHIGTHPDTGSGVLIDWSDAYFYGREIEDTQFYITNPPSNITDLIKEPNPQNLENGVKSMIGHVMSEIGSPKASQVYNTPHRFTFDQIADILIET